MATRPHRACLGRLARAREGACLGAIHGRSLGGIAGEGLPFGPDVGEVGIDPAEGAPLAARAAAAPRMEPVGLVRPGGLQALDLVGVAAPLAARWRALRFGGAGGDGRGAIGLVRETYPDSKT